MEEIIVTVIGHATAVRTERARRIAEASGAVMPPGTIAGSGTIHATAEAAATAPLSPRPGVTATAVAAKLTSRRVYRPPMARCAVNPIRRTTASSLTLPRTRTQLSPHRPRRKPRRRRKLSVYASSKL